MNIRRLSSILAAGTILGVPAFAQGGPAESRSDGILLPEAPQPPLRRLPSPNQTRTRQISSLYATRSREAHTWHQAILREPVRSTNPRSELIYKLRGLSPVPKALKFFGSEQAC
jgi:hypothetical protein